MQSLLLHPLIVSNSYLLQKSAIESQICIYDLTFIAELKTIKAIQENDVLVTLCVQINRLNHYQKNGE